MVRENVSRLGPQCFSCKRRRVRCDAATPSCVRCQRDIIDCPGYSKQARRNYDQVRTELRSGDLSNLSRASRKGYHLADSMNGEQEYHMTTSSLLESREDRERRVLLDSSLYYNQQMLPKVIPGHLPFRRRNLEAVHWTFAPPIIQRLMVLMVKSHQSKRSGCGETLNSEICAYRGSTLNELKAGLSQAATEPHGIILSAVLTLMGTDMMFPDFGHWNWAYHFKAARDIISLRGGFGKCFFDLPHSQGLLTRYMMLDIISTTTCCIKELDHDSIQTQATYVPILLLREKSMLEHGHVWPLPLLKAAMDTTALRWDLEVVQGSSRLKANLVKHDGILLDISRFDCPSWASRVARHGLAQPLRTGDVPKRAVSEAWEALASCYKQATLLYCIMSIRAPDRGKDKQDILSIQHFLAQQLVGLLSLATSNPDGPIEAQLWKFCIWPAAISIYVSICWCCCDFQQMRCELEQMHRAASTLRSSPLMRCWVMMSDIAARRAHHIDAAWKWGDGFPVRSAVGVC